MKILHNLTEKEKSIIYCALVNFHKDNQISANVATTQIGNHAFAKLLQWIADEAKELQQKLFTDAEPGQYDPFSYYVSKNQPQPTP